MEQRAPLTPVHESPTRPRRATMAARVEVDAMPSAANAKPIATVVLGVCLCCVGLALPAVAMPFILRSERTLSLANLLGPSSEQFDYLGEQACNVTWIKHCWHTTVDGQDPSIPGADREEGAEPHCWQTYKAVFTLGQGGRHFESWPEFAQARVGDCGTGCHPPGDAGQTMPSRRFMSGRAYPCWRARGPSIDKRFRCGNDLCLKLNDPAELVPDGRRATVDLAVAGAVALVGLCALCACARLVLRCEKQQADAELRATSNGAHLHAGNVDAHHAAVLGACSSHATLTEALPPARALPAPIGLPLQSYRSQHPLCSQIEVGIRVAPPPPGYLQGSIIRQADQPDGAATPEAFSTPCSSARSWPMRV